MGVQNFQFCKAEIFSRSPFPPSTRGLRLHLLVVDEDVSAASVLPKTRICFKCIVAVRAFEGPRGI